MASSHMPAKCHCSAPPSQPPKVTSRGKRNAKKNRRSVVDTPATGDHAQHGHRIEPMRGAQPPRVDRRCASRVHRSSQGSHARVPGRLEWRQSVASTLPKSSRRDNKFVMLRGASRGALVLGGVGPLSRSLAIEPAREPTKCRMTSLSVDRTPRRSTGRLSLKISRARPLATIDRTARQRGSRLRLRTFCRAPPNKG